MCPHLIVRLTLAHLGDPTQRTVALRIVALVDDAEAVAVRVDEDDEVIVRAVLAFVPGGSGPSSRSTSAR
jgi:RNase P/RNase MRP subunit POP5